MVEKKWVIYALTCPMSNKIRYIGKSNNFKVRYKQHLKDIGTETYKKLWIAKLKSQSLIPIPSILEVAETEIEARNLENKHVEANLATIYNIFMPGKKMPTCADYRKIKKIIFDCEFELMKMDTDKYNKL